jgi:hypothetical protein
MELMPPQSESVRYFKYVDKSIVLSAKQMLFWCLVKSWKLAKKLVIFENSLIVCLKLFTIN